MADQTLELFGARIRGAWRVIQDGLSTTMADIALAAQKEARLSATRRLKVRSGNLRASINGVARKAAGGLPEVELSGGGPAAPYLPMQEKGGTIKPRNARLLTIPTPRNRTPAGLARFPSPRLQPNLRPVRAGPVGWALADDDGVQWIGVKSITLRGRGFMEAGLNRAVKKLEPGVRDLFRVSLGGE